MRRTMADRVLTFARQRSVYHDVYQDIVKVTKKILPMIPKNSIFQQNM